MKTQVEFRSDKFPPYDDEEERINPGLWGKNLAEYLQENPSHQGLKVTGIGAEDWGWMVELENEEWFIRKWFKKIDATVQVGRVAEALKKVLESNPDIRNVNWLLNTTNNNR